MWNCLCLRDYEKRWRKIAATMRKWRGVTQIVYIEQLWMDSQKASSMKHNKISKPMTRTFTYWKRCQHFLLVGELSYPEVSSSQATTRLGGWRGGINSESYLQQRHIGPHFDVMVCGWLDIGRQEDTVHINAHWLHLLWEVVKPKCWPDLRCERELKVWTNFPVVF